MLKRLNQLGDTISASQQWSHQAAVKRLLSGFVRLGRSQAGDTIVEVLITIAIISAVLVGAYISTNENIANTQDAQERSQATKLAQTQLEYLRSASIDPDTGLSTAIGNCYTSAGPKKNAGDPGDNPCVIDSSNSQAGADSEPAYDIEIFATPATPGSYTVRITWDNIGGAGQDKVEMYYQP